jgi:mannose/fructose-specific phosphotransferase system component IIA
MSDARDAGAPGPRAIIAGHADFAEGLVSAVDAITGQGAAFLAISARDLSGQELEARLRRAIDDTGIRVVFTDLQAGSCTMAARRVLRDRTDVLFVCGANLPMLLDFALASDRSPTEAAQHALERGRAAIASVGGPRTGEGAR